MQKLRIIRNLKPRKAFYRINIFKNYANWDLGADTARAIRITIETENAVYEHLLPRPGPVESSAVSVRPTLALCYSGGQSDSKHDLVEELDRAPGFSTGASRELRSKAWD